MGTSYAHSRPSPVICAFDMKLTLDGGTFAVRTKEAFLKADAIRGRDDEDLRLGQGAFSTGVSVVLLRIGGWGLRGHGGGWQGGLGTLSA